MDSGLLNSLVGDYLASLGSKLAEKFKKETKATPLPPGSPGLKEMVKHFNESSPTKRKLEMANGTPAKKAKKVCMKFYIARGVILPTCWLGWMCSVPSSYFKFYWNEWDSQAFSPLPTTHVARMAWIIKLEHVATSGHVSRSNLNLARRDIAWFYGVAACLAWAWLRVISTWSWCHSKLVHVLIHV